MWWFCGSGKGWGGGVKTKGERRKERAVNTHWERTAKGSQSLQIHTRTRWKYCFAPPKNGVSRISFPLADPRAPSLLSTLRCFVSSGDDGWEQRLQYLPSLLGIVRAARATVSVVRVGVESHGLVDWGDTATLFWTFDSVVIPHPLTHLPPLPVWPPSFTYTTPHPHPPPPHPPSISPSFLIPLFQKITFHQHLPILPFQDHRTADSKAVWGGW